MLRFSLVKLTRSVSVLFALSTAVLVPRQAQAQLWFNIGHDAQHTGESTVSSQIPQQVYWSTPIDLFPQYTNGNLYIHYGSLLVTYHNTIIAPIKTGTTGGFAVNAFNGANGNVIWTQPSDYYLPAADWTPSYGPALTPNGKLYFAGAGGTVFYRSNLDSTGAVTPTRIAFYGIANYNANPAAFTNSMQIDTPIVSDASGNIYFGYQSSGAAVPGYPNGIPSGLARISSTGVGSFVSAATASGNATISQIQFNCAPAISADGSTVYVNATNGYASYGYLCSLNASNLTPKASVLLIDPHNGGDALVDSDGTASPTIGPDGDVYIGVLESGLGSNHYRGWMLHFNSTLSTTKTPGAFGWDDTPSIVPAAAVPSYTGTSSYLLLTKYNNYANAGGNGENKMAVLDPNATEVDPVTGTAVMKEVITVLGPTPNPNLPGVYEWCINSAAIDAPNKCAVVNSEDGHVYRWNFVTNTLSPAFTMAPPTGAAYTSTVIGADGKVYSINDATIFSCGNTGTQPGAADVSSNVTVTRSVFTYNRSTSTYNQLVTLRNNSVSALSGPISLVLGSLANATLTNVSGTTANFAPSGRPYVDVTFGSLAPGASASVTLQFAYTGPGSITYTTQVVAGPGEL